MRMLVAAFGNELRADDGFGIAVLRRLELEEMPLEDGTEIRMLEVGTGGIWLAQELLTRWDRLIVIDAMRRGEVPGTVYVLKVEDVEAATDVDMHLAVPARALGMAKALGALPADTYLVGCEPACVDDLVMTLTPAVHEAVERAAAQVRRLLELPS